MRMDTEIRFYSESERQYNPQTHAYEGDATLIATVMANVTDLGTNRSRELFGDIDSQAKVLRLATLVATPWSYLMIEGNQTHYVLMTDRRPLKGTTLIVGEAHG